VWAADVTFIPMPAGFAYLVAILDVFSRRVLAWRSSNTMEARFCVEAWQGALSLHGTPASVVARPTRRPLAKPTAKFLSPATFAVQASSPKGVLPERT
jgi:transposase InsO family protein